MKRKWLDSQTVYYNIINDKQTTTRLCINHSVLRFKIYFYNLALLLYKFIQILEFSGLNIQE